MLFRSMGNLKSILGMMPGMAQMRDQLNSLDEREFDRVEAMVRSMTPRSIATSWSAPASRASG